MTNKEYFEREGELLRQLDRASTEAEREAVWERVFRLWAQYEPQPYRRARGAVCRQRQFWS